MDNYAYAFGKTIAVYYAEKYKQDPEKTKNDIYNFMRHIGYSDEITMFNKFGIDRNELASSDYITEQLQDSMLNIDQNNYKLNKRRNLYEFTKKGN